VWNTNKYYNLPFISIHHGHQCVHRSINIIEHRAHGVDHPTGWVQSLITQAHHARRNLENHTYNICLTKAMTRNKICTSSNAFCLDNSSAKSLRRRLTALSVMSPTDRSRSEIPPGPNSSGSVTTDTKKEIICCLQLQTCYQWMLKPSYFGGIIVHVLLEITFYSFWHRRFSHKQATIAANQIPSTPC
jgi:hypothetical protein